MKKSRLLLFILSLIYLFLSGCEIEAPEIVSPVSPVSPIQTPFVAQAEARSTVEPGITPTPTPHERYMFALDNEVMIIIDGVHFSMICEQYKLYTYNNSIDLSGCDVHLSNANDLEKVRVYLPVIIKR